MRALLGAIPPKAAAKPQEIKMSMSKDFTEVGTRLEGAYENDRNTENSALYKAIIREVYGVTDVICGHHLVYQKEERHADGFTYTFVQEIPSADTLIFDHDVAKRLWGEQHYLQVLTKLATEPVESRDKLLGELFYSPVRPH